MDVDEFILLIISKKNKSFRANESILRKSDDRLIDLHCHQWDIWYNHIEIFHERDRWHFKSLISYLFSTKQILNKSCVILEKLFRKVINSFLHWNFEFPFSKKNQQRSARFFYQLQVEIFHRKTIIDQRREFTKKINRMFFSDNSMWTIVNDCCSLLHFFPWFDQRNMRRKPFEISIVWLSSWEKKIIPPQIR